MYLVVSKNIRKNGRNATEEILKYFIEIFGGKGIDVSVVKIKKKKIIAQALKYFTEVLFNKEMILVEYKN